MQNLFAEVTVMQAFEAAAMTRFVLAHLVHRVVDGVEIELLREDGEVFLARACAVLGIDAHLEVLLRGVREDFAEELGEFCRMLSLFERVAFERLCDFRIPLAIGLAAHREVHADFGAFAREVLAQALDDLFIDALRDADAMLIRERQLAALLDEFRCRRFADRALCGRLRAFIDITADGANEFFHVNSSYQNMMLVIAACSWRRTCERVDGFIIKQARIFEKGEIQS